MRDKGMFVATTIMILLLIILTIFWFFTEEYTSFAISLIGLSFGLPFYIYGIKNDNRWY